MPTSWQAAFIAVLRNTDIESLPELAEVAEREIRISLNEESREGKRDVLRSALTCVLVMRAVRLGWQDNKFQIAA